MAAQTFTRFGSHQIIFNFILHKKTGTLLFQPYARKLFFDQGDLVFASSESPQEHFSNLLVLNGVLSEDQLREIKESLNKGESLGKKLKERNLASSKELAQALKQQITTIIERALSLKEGSCDIQDALPSKLPKLKIQTSALMLQSLVQLDSLDLDGVAESSSIEIAPAYEEVRSSFSFPAAYDDFFAILENGGQTSAYEFSQKLHWERPVIDRLMHVLNLLGMARYVEDAPAALERSPQLALPIDEDDDAFAPQEIALSPEARTDDMPPLTEPTDGEESPFDDQTLKGLTSPNDSPLQAAALAQGNMVNIEPDISAAPLTPEPEHAHDFSNLDLSEESEPSDSGEIAPNEIEQPLDDDEPETPPANLDSVSSPQAEEPASPEDPLSDEPRLLDEIDLDESQDELGLEERPNDQPLDDSRDELSLAESLEEQPLDDSRDELSLVESLEEQPLDDSRDELSLAESLEEQPLGDSQDELDLAESLEGQSLDDSQDELDLAESLEGQSLDDSQDELDLAEPLDDQESQEPPSDEDPEEEDPAATLPNKEIRNALAEAAMSADRGLDLDDTVRAEIDPSVFDEPGESRPTGPHAHTPASSTLDADRDPDDFTKQDEPVFDREKNRDVLLPDESEDPWPEPAQQRRSALVPLVIILLIVATAVLIYLKPWNDLLPEPVEPEQTASAPTPPASTMEVPGTESQAEASSPDPDEEQASTDPIAQADPQNPGGAAEPTTPAAEDANTPREAEEPRVDSKEDANARIPAAPETALETPTATLAFVSTMADDSLRIFHDRNARYSVAFLVACQPETMNNLLKRSGEEEVFAVPRTVNGKSCFLFSWGSFSSFQEASEARKQLPALFKSDTPWVVNLKKYLE